MTIAASQGLTATTALTYGHGANAYALYPGITRGREANHLWLPTAALEDDETRARLGAARSEAEQLHRAIDAYAKLLRQDRPDGMVSDQLRPQPQTVAAGEPARQAEDDQHRQEQPAPAAPPWREREFGHLAGDLHKAAARREVLAAQLEEQAAAADRTAAAAGAVLDTDQSMSPTRDYRPLDQQLTARRAELSQWAADMDLGDRARHQRLLHNAGSTRADAAEQRRMAAGIRAEAAMRTTLTRDQAVREMAERLKASRQAAARAQQTADARAEHRRRDARRYEPPQPSRGRWPSGGTRAACRALDPGHPRHHPPAVETAREHANRPTR